MKAEDSTPKTSYENIIEFASMHGFPVAVTHIIGISNLQATKIFFVDGFSYTSLGFAVGEKQNDILQETKIMGLLSVIQMIPGMPLIFDSQMLLKLGTSKTDKTNLDLGKNLVYNFISPDKIQLDFVLNSDGMKTFEQNLQLMSEEEINYITYENDF